MVTFNLDHVKVVVGSFSAHFSTLGCSSRMADGRAKWYVVDTIDLQKICKAFILGLIRCTCLKSIC